MAQEILRPNAPGDERGIAQENPSVLPHWDKVDEASPDFFTTCVFNSQGSPAQRDLYALPSSGVGAGDINSVRVYMNSQGTNGIGEKAWTAIKTGGTAYEGSEIALSGIFAAYSTQYNTNPQAGGAWTWAQVNALQIGVKIQASADKDSQARCTQVYVVIDYTEAPPVVASGGLASKLVGEGII